MYFEAEECVMFVNAGGEAFNEEAGGVKFLGDTFFDGGNVFCTNDPIVEGGDYPSIYQSARVGSFCYRIDNLSPGDYVVDLHFVEIINVNGPKGIRVFDVYIQEEKASLFTQTRLFFCYDLTFEKLVF
jgi:kinesin family protein C2/C3